MDTLGPAGESLRLSEHYRQMSDDELIALARQNSELTDLAKQALAVEIHQRRLESEVRADEAQEPEQHADDPPKLPIPDMPSDLAEASDGSDAEDPYASDRQLVELCTVWSLRDARQVQSLLDTAGIPFYMGPQKAWGVDAANSNFAKGVSVQVMAIGFPWAADAMKHYGPKDAPPEGKIEEATDVAIHCPRCHSTDVVFDQLVSGPADDQAPPKYEWTCGSCGNEWKDEGVETER